MASVLTKFRFNGLNLRGKILLIFCFSTGFLLAAVGYGFWSFNSSLKTFENDVMRSQANAVLVVDLEATFKRQVQEWKNVLLRGSKPDALTRYWGEFEKAETEIRSAAARLAQNIREPDSAALVGEFVAAHTKMGEAYRRGLTEFKAQNFNPAAGDAAVSGIDRAPTELLSKAKDKLLSAAAAQSGIAVEGANRGIVTSAILLAIALALGAVLFALAIQRGITAPLGRLNEAMADMAQGNLVINIGGADRTDEVGAITKSLLTTAERIGSTIGQIKKSGREVTNASVEIASATTDLSQRTEEQAASLEETAASMEQLSSTVRRNAEYAQNASDSAANTREVADRGGRVVSDAVTAMAKIEESSRKISDIITVIDEIARQTNLLALNAAVEAARAGEAGRGFAVVASEVRSLAQRSSQAAKDIKDLITNSNELVRNGVELVNRAGGSLNEIVDSIKQVASIVVEIANASGEQANGIEQINKALMQMDNVTQQNSALVEENAATAKTLEHQAKAMDEQVAYFRLGDASDGAVVKFEAARAKPARNAGTAPPATKPVPQMKQTTQTARPAPRPVAKAMPSQDADWKEF